MGCRGCIDGQLPDVRRQSYREIIRRTFPGDMFEGPPRDGVTPTPFKHPARTKTAEPSEADRIAYARTVWQASRTIPQDAANPARCWLAARQLWWVGFPLPPMVRWIPRQPVEGWPYGGSPWTNPALVVLAAQPAHWIDAWPHLPVPDAVHLVYITRAGEQAPPNKRTYGVPRETVVIIGDPTPSDAGLNVCEGLADGLALSARHWQPSMCTLTRPPTVGPLVDYAALWPGVTIHSDADAAGPGQAAAWLMARALEYRARCVLPHVGKDAADAARHDPLPDIEGLRAEVGKLADAWEARGLPRWEALRRVALELNE